MVPDCIILWMTKLKYRFYILNDGSKNIDHQFGSHFHCFIIILKHMSVCVALIIVLGES